MRDFEITDFTGHCYHDGIVSTARRAMWGEFSQEETKKSGLKTFSFIFKNRSKTEGDELLPKLEAYDILDLSIAESGGGYEVTLNCSHNDGENTDLRTLHFYCEKISVELCSYKGFSYKNIYSGNEALEKEREQWYKPEFLLSTEERDIGGSITAIVELYGEEPAISDRNISAHLAVGRYLKDGSVICENYTTPQHRTSFFSPIHHSNGHLYYHYSTDLYGAAFMEIDTGRHYAYVPEGYEHDYRSECGESFIVLRVNYDRDSDLLACSGCYWGGNDEVFVMDFSDPLNYDPHMVRLADEVLADDEDDNLYFARWDNESLILKGSSGMEYTVTKARLLEMLDEKRKC